ncbi:UDP-N-acetylmuramoyl-tripeptide--D-alanyl-D-alanine ligase [Cyanobium sp. BA5m-21]|uniref:UDP-N-acetylmuramoyl-tripeptide--D-alanyl-D- alanine ligase n=1 Tax=unclassified Cyanobium TaxID=2627006 RepID=UPI0020CF929E|nr:MULTISPECIES: UDP-N-acetylmuramoyl-tripeptide--D-alanyl-D-alanine ligase [unclassified Cyanobium]MCP9904162.1 UDP-N-acetylmuramoyl-tripeptide--D-alanyl-D-alanine ligase [Cyanobium sp. BA5m-10]MCP9906533.1 UDP-N-acetylmuramoyl-tripeptide--D-alanyl-D-alanine ligase [Cyanobium sp. BA5m-21]
MSLRLAQLQELWGQPATGPLALDQAELKLAPQAICTDSRQLSGGDLFLPLIGERFDGHGFLAAALEAGAAALIAQAGHLAPASQASVLAAAAKAHVPLWLVPDTLQAYQDLAGLWRLQLAAPVVAVTGSAGKTTTRELIRSALAPLGPIWASSGNENNDVGVPLTLLGAGPDQAALVVEMGMRGLGEIERLSRCASPDVAVITNIGTAHIGRLGSREAIATAKCEIVAGLRPDGLVVIPAGDPLLDHALARVWSGRVVRVALQGEGHEAAADLVGSLDCQGEILELAGVALPVPLEGVHHARNLMLAMAVARELGLEPERWRPLQVDLPGGRSRRLQQNGVLILDETYNASPEAVLAALELLAQQPGRRFAVLGTMLELGEQSLALHRSVAERARQLDLDGLVIVDQGEEGAAMVAAATGLSRLRQVDCPEAAAEPLQQWLRPGDVLLLKASRGVALERLIPLL